MRYGVRKGQVSYGEAIGILLIENYVPFIPGDVANATTYRYPVRFQRIEGASVERLFSGDLSLYENVRKAAIELKQEGVRAVTGDCGFLAVHQQQLADELLLPVFLSSLMQIPFISQITGNRQKIGIITADSASLSAQVLSSAGVSPDLQKRLAVRGLEDSVPFRQAVVEETGFLDASEIEQAVVLRALELKQESSIGALLLECSLLPPYAAAVQEAVELPVFDYVTMIDYVYSSVVKRRFDGFM